MKRQQPRYVLEYYLQDIISRTSKDWTHKQIEDSPIPTSAVADWVANRAYAIERDLQRKGIDILEVIPCNYHLKKWGMMMLQHASFLSCRKGGLPLVGLLRYKGKSFDYFDGKICLYLAVPKKNQDYGPGAQTQVYFTGQIPDPGQSEAVGNLVRVDHVSCAYGISFAGDRMKTFDHLAVALVESIGKI